MGLAWYFGFATLCFFLCREGRVSILPRAVSLTPLLPWARPQCEWTCRYQGSCLLLTCVTGPFIFYQGHLEDVSFLGNFFVHDWANSYKILITLWFASKQGLENRLPKMHGPLLPHCDPGARRNLGKQSEQTDTGAKGTLRLRLSGE